MDEIRLTLLSVHGGIQSAKDGTGRAMVLAMKLHGLAIKPEHR
jgi:hypothetical protein